MQTLPLVALALAAGSAAALPPGRPRQAARAAIPAAALALASLEVAGGGDWRATVLPQSFLAVSAGLWLIGLGVPAGVAFGTVAGRRLPGLRGGWCAGAALAALAFGWSTTSHLVRSGGWRSSVVAVLLAAVAGICGWLAGKAGIADWVRRLDQRVFAVPAVVKADRGRSPRRSLWWGHAAFAVVALLVPHLLVVLVASAGATLLGALLERGRPAAGRPWPAAAALLGLGAVAVLLLRAAWGLPLSLSALRDGPFSPALELTVVPILALAGWPLLGLFPFHRARLGPITPLAGAALWLAVAGPLLPGGVAYWQPVLFPLAAVSVWYAAAIRDLPLAVAGLGAAGLMTAPGPAALAGAALIAAAAALRVVPEVAALPLRQVLAGATGCGAALAMVPVLTGGLPAETFYTVLIAAGTAGTLGGRGLSE